MTVQHDDLDLARRALSGDVESRRRFAERLECLPRQVAVACRRLGVRLDEQQQNDVAQDVAAILWRKLGTFEGRATLEGWAWTFVRYAVRNRARSIARAPRLTPLSAAEGVALACPDPSTETSPVLDRTLLERCLAALPDETREVLALKHLQGLTFGAIGERVGLPEGTVKSRYHRGLKAAQAVLKRLLAEETHRV